MHYKQLGHSGLIVSRLAFGAMTFTTGAPSAVAKADRQSAEALMGRALDNGINFFDTADVYAQGRSEEIVGGFLKSRRDAVVLSTKTGFRTGPGQNEAGLSRKRILSACEASLARLGTDYVDIYSPHCPDPFTPLEETLAALETLVQHGKTRYLGCSNWPAWLTAKAVALQRERGWSQFITAQWYYSLVGRQVEAEVLPMLRDAGMGLTAWSPLAGGFLSGKYTWDNLGDKDNRLSGFDVLPTDKAQGFALVDTLREIGRGYDATPAQVAIAWLLAQPDAATILLGASKMGQLDDNLGAATLALSLEDLKTLDTLTQPPANMFSSADGESAMTDSQTKAALGA